jgi:hypothetical protein
VSRRIREEFANGREYYRHQGQPLLVTPAAAPGGQPGGTGASTFSSAGVVGSCVCAR